MHSLCCIAPVPLEREGAKGDGDNSKMLISPFEPSAPQRSLKERQNATSLDSRNLQNPKGISINNRVGHCLPNSSQSMASSGPLSNANNNGVIAVGTPQIDGKVSSNDSVHSSRAGPDLSSGGAGKFFTVTPEGGMKTATNFSGELFQVIDTKASSSPQGGALADNVVGILYKWVNYGKGWRPRLFALREGVFSYYKVHGHDKVTVNDNRFRNFRIIGEDAQRFSKKQNKTHTHPHLHIHSADQNQFEASGKIHLKVRSERERDSIDQRFCSIHRNTLERTFIKTLQCGSIFLQTLSAEELIEFSFQPFAMPFLSCLFNTGF